MNAEQLLLSEGASYFGNRLIYRNQDVGVKSDSGMTLLPLGEEHYARLSDITDVAVKVETVRKPRAKKPDPEPVVEQTLDDLLAD